MAVTLAAAARASRGKNAARRLRRAGQVPAVVYGGAEGDVSVAVDPTTLLRILHSESGLNTILDLHVEGNGESQVLVKALQLDPVTDALLHIDFYRLAMDKVITVTVPVHLTGEALGVKLQGGLVDFVTREVPVECMPTDIPERIEVDITPLMIGDGIRVKDVTSGVTWKPATDLETLLVHVAAPKVEAEAEEEEGEAAAEGEAEAEEPQAEGGGEKGGGENWGARARG